MARQRSTEEDREIGRRLGSVLREARNAAGMSAQQVASLSRLSIDTVRSVETGRTASPAFVTVWRIADAVGLSLSELGLAVRSVDGG